LYCHLPAPNDATGRPAVPDHILSTQSHSRNSCHSSIHGSNVSDFFLNPKQRTGKH
jgi:hypothetical protein